MLNKLPKDLILLTANYCDYTTAKQLALTNKSISKILSHLYFKKRADAPNKNTIMNAIIISAITGINEYLLLDKPHPGWIHNHWTEPDSLEYDKDYHRAQCFRDIIANEKIDIIFRLLAVSALLSEKNGTKLKARVECKIHDNLKSIIFSPKLILNKIILDNYKINETKLAQLQKIMINNIHNPTNYHSDHSTWDETLELNAAWQKQLYEKINNAMQEKQKTNICTIS